MSGSPRGASVRRLYTRLVVDKLEPPDPSIPIVVEDGLVVWPDGRYIAALPAEHMLDGDV